MENNETKKPKKKIIPLVIGILILIGLVYGVKRYMYSLHHEVTDDAQIEGDISPVLTRITGYVEKINFEENQRVKKGDTLIIIDNRDLLIKADQAQAALDNAVASVSLAEANVETARAGLSTANASYEAAKVKAWKSNKDFNRYSNLKKDTVISEQAFDNAKADKDNSEAMLSGAESQKSSAAAQIVAAQKQIVAAKAGVASKKADFEYTQLQLSYSNITAPATGFASRKNVEPGQLINAGAPLFAIVGDTGVYVTANFKETQLEHMVIGQPVEITVDAFPNTKLSGKVYAFSAATGAKFSLLPPDNATGNFVKVVQRIPVKIIIEGDTGIVEKLRPGMSVKVAVAID